MKTKFIPYTSANFSAETPFLAKFPGNPEPVSVVFNQFGQLLHTTGRALVEVAPTEMEVPVEDKAEPKQ